MSTETSAYKRPLPVPNEASQPFFAGAREHRLMIQRCSACGAFMWPVHTRCINCLGSDIGWVQASGQGTLYSFVLMHQVFHPGFASEVPYNIAEVDLAEGLRIISNIADCSNDQLRIGMPLEVTFEVLTDEITLPRFKPVSQPESTTA
ncbi:MAG TPA: OB-fold domain-containing protein [Ktedonobacteraceae bacterium]